MTELKVFPLSHRDTPAEKPDSLTKPYSTAEDPPMVQKMDMETIYKSKCSSCFFMRHENSQKDHGLNFLKVDKRCLVETSTTD